MDRGRVFDNTSFASQTGGAARAWSFTTPPVATGIYEGVLGTVAAQLCSGDILSLPTMCHVEFMGGKPVRAQGTKVTLDFVLHEVQPAKVLLRYAPGDTITGESFTRSTTAYQLNASGVLESKAINVKRDGHYIGGVRTLLLENARTNNMLWASDFSNAVWSKAAITVTTGIADPAGGTSACTLTSTATNGNVTQNLGAGASIVRTNTIWLRRRTGAGLVGVLDPLNSVWTYFALTSGWQRFTVVGAGGTGRLHGVIVAVSGDEVDAWVAQQEDAAFPSSEIPTTTAAVTRGADVYSLPFSTPPQEMSVYTKFVEAGTILSPTPTAVLSVGALTGTAPILLLYNGGALYGTFHDSPTGAVTSFLAVAPVRGDTVELLSQLFGNASVQAVQSINAAVETFGAQSAAKTFGAAWSAATVVPNIYAATWIGFNAFQSIKIVAGARSLAEMRAA